MRWCTYSVSAGPVRVGIVEGEQVRGLAEPGSLIEVIASPQALAAAGAAAMLNPAEVLPLAEVRLHAPIPVPPSVRDFMAFEEHVATSSRALGLSVNPLWYQLPVFYFSNPAAIIGPNDDIAISPGSTAFDFELEIAAVIGLPGRDIRAGDADQHIAGYTIMCDWSARDLQQQEMKLNLGPAKGKDSATSLGPVLVTLDELEPYRSGAGYDLEMTASVNGKPYSNGNFSTIHWDFGSLIEHAARGTELRTGDVIGSGTVGTGCILELSRSHGSEAYPWLAAGDVVRLAVERIGELVALITPAA